MSRFITWLLERKEAFFRLSPRQRGRAVLLALGVAVLLGICLILPGALLIWQDGKLEEKVWQASQVYSARALSTSSTMNSFYNRLFLMNGQWEGQAETVLAEYEYGDGVAESTLGKLNVGMRDSNGKWHGREQIFESGNAIRAVCNLDDFGLMPFDWNFYYNDWPLTNVFGTVFSDGYFGKYSCVIWRFDFDSSMGGEATLVVDDETGDFVGFRVEYDNLALWQDILPNYNRVMNALMMESTGATYTALGTLLNQLYEEDSSFQNAYTNWLMLLAYENLHDDIYLGLNSESSQTGTSSRRIRVPEETETEATEETAGIFSASPKAGLRIKTENSSARLIREFVNLLQKGQEEASAVQPYILSTVSDYLSRLGYRDIQCVESTAQEGEILALQGMSPPDKNSCVYSCTDFSSGDQFYFVINSREGCFEVYFTTNSRNNS